LPGDRRLRPRLADGIRCASPRRGWCRRARAGAGADPRRRPGRARPAAPVASPPRERPPPLRLRDVRAARGAVAVAVCAQRPARAAAVVRGRYPGRRRAGRPRVHDRMRISPFWRNLSILALIALAIVLLNAETALATATVLLRIA